jgi:hypothetical protein
MGLSSLTKYDGVCQAPVTADAQSVVELANFLPIVGGSVRNDALLACITKDNCSYMTGAKEARNARWKHSHNDSAKCTCPYCVIARCDGGFLHALALSILGEDCAVDEETGKGTDGIRVHSACIFCLRRKINVPAEIRDSSGTWMQSKVTRPTIGSVKVRPDHIVAAACGIDVEGVDKHGVPVTLSKVCSRRHCVNPLHFEKPGGGRSDTVNKRR